MAETRRGDLHASIGDIGGGIGGVGILPPFQGAIAHFTFTGGYARCAR